MEMALSVMDAWSFESFRMLHASEGRLVVPKEGITDLFEVSRPHEPFVYVFDTEAAFTFVIPDDVIDLCKHIDWESLAQENTARALIVEVVDKLVELRGIVTMCEAYDEFMRIHCIKYSFDSFSEYLLLNLHSSDCQYAAFDSGDEFYLAQLDLTFEYVENREGASGAPDLEYDFLDRLLMLEGEPDDHLSYLIHEHQIKPPPLCQSMVEAESLFDWVYSQPSVIALRNYLDAHVPNSRDDFNFADQVIEELIIASGAGFDVAGVLEFLKSESFEFDDRSLQKVLDLTTSLANTLPLWGNNGWSAYELLEKETGHKLFFNEDGGLQKIGRNDPCPCKSGKKYKKCCGS